LTKKIDVEELQGEVNAAIGVAQVALSDAGDNPKQPGRGKGRPKDADRAKDDPILAKRLRLQEQIVGRLIQAAGPNHKWKDALTRLKKDTPENRQFLEQAREAGVTLDHTLIDRARRKNSAAAQTN
jgi:hypothetical protein